MKKYKPKKWFIYARITVVFIGIFFFSRTTNVVYNEMTVKKLPLSNILIETDAPFLAPHPFRGKENESKYIPIIAQDLALYTGKTVEEIMDITTQNARKLFNLK